MKNVLSARPSHWKSTAHTEEECPYLADKHGRSQKSSLEGQHQIPAAVCVVVALCRHVVWQLLIRREPLVDICKLLADVIPFVIP